MAFHALLGVFDGLGHHAVLDGLAFLHAQLFHESGNAFRTEDAHEVVFQRQIEAGGTGVALTTGAAAQLIVDAAAFMAFRTENVQAAEFLHALAEHDVGAAAGHVGGDGHMSLLTGLRHDGRFLGVMLGVQHAVRHAFLLEHGGEKLGCFDGDGTHEHGLTGLVELLDGLDDGMVLLALRAEDEIGQILADHGLVGGNGDGFQMIDLVEFHGFGLRRAGHARKLVVHAEVVLEGDAGQRLVFGLHLHAFLGFQRLMQTVAEAAAGHETARELVDDDHLALVAHDVVHITLEAVMRLERLKDMVLIGNAGRVEQIVDAEYLFALGHACVGEHGGLGLFVQRVVLFGLELTDHGIHGLIQVGGLVAGAGNDERGTGFIYEDGVHFVHDGEVVTALHELLGIELHVVAQVVEAEFVVRAVGDVAGIGGLAFLVGQSLHDDAHGKTEELVETPHPFRVAAGEIVVHRDHVHALAGKGVQHHGQRGHQGLAFTGLHFRDLARVQHHAAHELHVVVTHAHDAGGCLAHEREHFGKHVVERAAAVLHLIAVFRKLCGDLLIGERLHLRFKGIALLQLGTQGTQITFIAGTEYFADQKLDHGYLQKKSLEQGRR